jgi:hypothetical protein
MIDGTFSLVTYLGWNNGWPTDSRSATFQVHGPTVTVTVERDEGRHETAILLRREARAKWKAMMANGWTRDYEIEGEREMALGGEY